MVTCARGCRILLGNTGKVLREEVGDNPRVCHHSPSRQQNWWERSRGSQALLPKCRFDFKKLARPGSTQPPALTQVSQHFEAGQIHKVIGLLVAATSAIELGKLHYKRIERAKIEALETTFGDFEGWMPITDEIRKDLTWWITELETQDRKIFRKAPEIEMFTDASNLGWAGCLSGHVTNGRWGPEEIDLHINARELLAILFTLKAFTHLLSSLYIKVMCDNTTAINYVNEMGGVRSVICDVISINIWDWSVKHDAWITASHIPGKCNILADSASRSFNTDTSGN
ncbi:hypothetical protein E2C01_066485 [Portunus trituberculatus]|uniref:Uncharacterized protein n=1 Tax=Portunus trituberculatus TaxID=210409 RepID=A0A5B7HTY7_PORTR|nr:hypothetical protein [Portunus trituberculatus]